MSRDDTFALIRRYLDAFNAKDFDAMLGCLSDDVIHDINQGGREIGKDKFRWFNALCERVLEADVERFELYDVPADGLEPCSGLRP